MRPLEVTTLSLLQLTARPIIRLHQSQESEKGPGTEAWNHYHASAPMVRWDRAQSRTNRIPPDQSLFDPPAKGYLHPFPAYLAQWHESACAGPHRPHIGRVL